LTGNAIAIDAAKFFNVAVAKLAAMVGWGDWRSGRSVTLKLAQADGAGRH